MNEQKTNDMNEQNRMRTLVLSYDVICKRCPNGMTAKNCKLRKTLEDWQEKYGYDGAMWGFGYKKLENGNLLAPNWYSFSDAVFEDGVFNLRKTIETICNGDCYRENRKKELENPEEYKKLPFMDTIIYAYTTQGVNCPAGKNHENCQLRKVVPETEQKRHIGCFKIGENTLVIPNEHYNSKTNAFHPMSLVFNEICDNCRQECR